MKLSGLFTILTSSAIQASQVLGAPTTETITGSNGVQYKVVELEWKAQAFVNGPFLNVTGTVEKVLAELHSINSNYEADWAPHLAASQNLTKRDQFPATGYNCFGRWPGAYRTHVLGGIEYLRGVSGTPGEGPGPGTCGRVSCSYNTGIHWCNDNSGSKSLPGYYWIADGAAYIVDHCQAYPGNSQTDILVAGQVFVGQSDWNVFVTGGDKC